MERRSVEAIVAALHAAQVRYLIAGGFAVVAHDLLKMKRPDSADPSSWNADWEGHQLAQRRRLARLSLAEKLTWLEDAQRVVETLASRQAGTAAPPEPSR